MPSTLVAARRGACPVAASKMLEADRTVCGGKLKTWTEAGVFEPIGDAANLLSISLAIIWEVYEVFVMVDSFALLGSQRLCVWLNRQRPNDSSDMTSC